MGQAVADVYDGMPLYCPVSDDNDASGCDRRSGSSSSDSGSEAPRPAPRPAAAAAAAAAAPAGAGAVSSSDFEDGWDGSGITAWRGRGDGASEAEPPLR